MFKRMRGVGGDTVTVFVDGVAIGARPGDCVASVLIRTPPHFSRNSPQSGSRRGPFCLMGVCMECAAVVDGVPSTLTCQVEVAEGMRIDRQTALPEITGTRPLATGGSYG